MSSSSSATKKGFKQATLSFTKPQLSVSGKAPVTTAGEQALRAEAEAALAAKTAVQRTPPTVAPSGVKIIVDVKRPIIAKLQIMPNAERREWSWVHLNISVREAEVKVADKRVTYTRQQKRAVLEQVVGMIPKDAAQKMKKIKGYEKVTGKQIKRWRDAAEKEQASGKRAKHGGGPKPNLAFEQAVIDDGSGKAARLRPTRTRIESSLPSPSFCRSSWPSAGRPSTPSSDQSVLWTLPPPWW